MSCAPFDTLNVATHVGDDPERVAQNLATAATILGVSKDHILFLSQVHGTTFHVAQAPFDHFASMAMEGDAVIADDPSVACAVRVADCVPILLADLRTGSAAAVHSGWRGTERNIAGCVVRAMEHRGSKSSDIVAAIGPHIEVCCFETGSDIALRLGACSTASDVVREVPGKGPHVDLRSIIHAQLVEAGVAPGGIDHVRGCTVCDVDRFFSYRRDGQRSGRLLAAIVPRRASQW